VSARRANPYRLKVNRSYTVGELAMCFNVHKNTVRSWQREGLVPNDRGRPLLFHGKTVRTFLIERKAKRKRPCPPGTLYCFRCREPRRPALRMVDFVELKSGSGNLRALCEACGTLMYRRARQSAIPTVMPGIDVQIRQAPPRLSGRPDPSLNCASDHRDSP
jgi:hypothetical protein